MEKAFRPISDEERGSVVDFETYRRRASKRATNTGAIVPRESRLAFKTAEVLRQLLDLDHPWIRDLPCRDLLDRALRDASCDRDGLPLSLVALKLLQHVLKDRIGHMTAETIPIHGYSQPGYGHNSAVRSRGMVKKTKEHKPVSRAALKVREKLAENVHLLMEAEYPASKYPTASEREKALAREAGCSWSTIQRILAPIKGGGVVVGTKIDTLADLAAVFGVSAMDLLRPNFASEHLRARPQPGEGEGAATRIEFSSNKINA